MFRIKAFLEPLTQDREWQTFFSVLTHDIFEVSDHVTQVSMLQQNQVFGNKTEQPRDRFKSSIASCVRLTLRKFPTNKGATNSQSRVLSMVSG